MHEHKKKHVLVVGLGASGLSACRLLIAAEAKVTALDAADTDRLRKRADELRASGADVRLGAAKCVEGKFDLVVVSPGVPKDSPLLAGLPGSTRVISELELGYQNSVCLNIGITGTNGKTTVTELVERILIDANRKTVAAGNIGTPLCDVVERSRDLDLITLEVSSFQLERIEFYRPCVAVLLNLSPDHLDRYSSMDDYARTKGRIFENQQKFDWAIAQSEAMAYLLSLGVEAPSKILTFSAANQRADIYQDRGLLISRIPDWSGPLLNMADCKLSGSHNMENVMAALAVGRVLRIPLEQMRQTILRFEPSPHRCEPVAERGGVRFINDSKSTNPDALEKALLSAPAGNGEPNVLLIAGGADKGLEYYSLGPTLARRVKQAYLLGETRDKLRASWSLFAPCELVGTVAQAVERAAQKARSGDVVLLSPGCASFDQFENYRQRGEVFRQSVMDCLGRIKGDDAATASKTVTERPSAAASARA